MHLLDLLLVGTVVGGALAGVAALVAAFSLCRHVWRIPNVPLNVRMNPFNILAYRELWTPAVATASSRLTLAATAMIGFALLSGFIALVRSSS